MKLRLWTIVGPDIEDVKVFWTLPEAQEFKSVLGEEQGLSEDDTILQELELDLEVIATAQSEAGWDQPRQSSLNYIETYDVEERAVSGSGQSDLAAIFAAKGQK